MYYLTWALPAADTKVDKKKDMSTLDRLGFLQNVGRMSTGQD